MKIITGTIFSTVLLAQTGCAYFSEDPCEEIQFTADQQHQCTQLQREIVRAKDSPIIRTELERRFEQDCTNIRYYRDDKTDDRCIHKDAEIIATEEKQPSDS
ncbi:hypothetical protein [Thalassotalea crassostreae]|uniref:hypothetical protein n=1 Tax=Thalassotalea crassostreae TaxID=1763536 RepID=UPI0008391347|nr:hypothetical protein [Thalassotalea crassostreae]